MDTLPHQALHPQRFWVREPTPSPQPHELTTLARYAVDSLVLLLQGVIAGPAFREFGQHGYDNAMTIAGYVGMLIGALFWGLGADIIGRRFAFNISLLLCSISVIIAGAMPNWPALGLWIALIGFGAGGNLVLDTTVFLEYLPGNKQWVLTLMAGWWGLGQAVTGFVAWGFLGEGFSFDLNLLMGEND